MPPRWFKICAAASTPPRVLFFTLSAPDSSCVSTSFKSRKAAGCTPSSVAIRSTTSLRKRSGSCARISLA